MAPYNLPRRLALMVTFSASRLSSSASLGAAKDDPGEGSYGSCLCTRGDLHI